MNTGKILAGVVLIVVGFLLNFTFIGICIGIPMFILGVIIAIAGTLENGNPRPQQAAGAAAAAANTVSCAKCGAENKADATFCINCGRKFKWVCQRCGTNNSVLNSKFCETCGSPRDAPPERKTGK